MKRAVFALAVTVCASRASLPDYRGHHLPNGCVPEAILFLQHYLKDHPQEAGEVICFSEKENRQVYGHSIALFSLAGRVAFWDHELGACETPFMVASWNRNADLAKVKRQYLAAIARKKDFIRRGLEPPPPKVAWDTKTCAVKTAQWLAQVQIEALVVKLESGEYAATFAYSGHQWVYYSPLGAGWANPDGHKPRRALIEEALEQIGIRGDFEVLRIASDQAPQLNPPPAAGSSD